MNLIAQDASDQASRTRRFGVGFATQLAGRFGATGVAFFTVAIAARYYGPEHYGQIVAALALATMFTAFSDFGLNSVITRHAANTETDLAQSLGRGLGLTMVYAAILVLVADIFAFAIYGWPESSIAWLVAGLAPFIYFQCIGSSLTPAFQVRDRFTPYAVAELMAAIATLCAILVAVHFDAGVWGYVIGANLGALCRAVILLVGARRLLDYGPVFDTSSWPGLLRQALPIGATGAVGVIYYRIDTILLSTMSTADQLGVYGLAYRVVTVVSMLPALLVTSSFYGLAKVAGDSLTLRLHTSRVLVTLLLIVIPIVAGGVVCSRDVVNLVGGERYISAAVPLVIMLIAIAIKGVNTVIGSAMQSAYRQRPVFVLSLLSLLINVVFLVLLVPDYGAKGAAIAMLVSESVSFLGIGVLSRHSLSASALLRGLVPCLVAASAMVFVLVYAPGPFLIRGFIGILCYVLVLMIARLGTTRLARGQSLSVEGG